MCGSTNVTLRQSFAHVDRTVQPISMRFKEVKVKMYVSLDADKLEVSTLTTFQQSGENRKWCVCHHYTVLTCRLLEIYVRSLTESSPVFIAADNLETSRQQLDTESEMCDTDTQNG